MEVTVDGLHYVNEEEEREDNRNWSEWRAFSDTRKPYHRIGVGEPDGISLLTITYCDKLSSGMDLG